MKVYIVIGHDWQRGVNNYTTQMYEEDVQTKLLNVCQTLKLAVERANEYAKNEIQSLKDLDGDDFSGWDYGEKVIERPLTEEELLSTKNDNRDACWYYLETNSGYGISIKEMEVEGS